MKLYSITSPKNFEAFTLEGRNDYLNDINIETLKSGDKIIIAWEGGNREVEIGTTEWDCEGCGATRQSWKGKCPSCKGEN